LTELAQSMIDDFLMGIPEEELSLFNDVLRRILQSCDSEDTTGFRSSGDMKRVCRRWWKTGAEKLSERFGKMSMASPEIALSY